MCVCERERKREREREREREINQLVNSHRHRWKDCPSSTEGRRLREECTACSSVYHQRVWSSKEGVCCTQ